MKISQILEARLAKNVWYGPKTFSKSAAVYPQFFKSKGDSEEVNYHVTSVKVDLQINKPAKNEDVQRACAFIHGGGGKILTMHSDPKVKATLRAKLPAEPTPAMIAVAEDMLGERSEAELLSSDKDMIAWLVHEGFDGYTDYAVLFSHEPLQAIVFNPNQIRVVQATDQI